MWFYLYQRLLVHYGNHTSVYKIAGVKSGALIPVKVFLGGVPWDVTEEALRETFVHFGHIQVEWPGKENQANPPKGYVYILFDNERQVRLG